MTDIQAMKWRSLLVASVLAMANVLALPLAADDVAPPAKPAAARSPAVVAADDKPAVDRENPFVVGINNSLVPPDLRASLKLPGREGILITTVFPDSPAQQAGLKANDVVLAVGDRKVTRRRDLILAIQATRGEKTPVEVVRAGTRLRIELTPVRRSELRGLNVAIPPRVTAVGTPQRQVLQSQLGWLRLGIAQGRVAHLGRWQGYGIAMEIDQGTLREDLDIGVSDTSGCLDYECASPREILRLELDSTGYFACMRAPADNAAVVHVEVLQVPGGPLTLTVGKDKPEVFRAPSVWHLLLTHPEACRRHLLPLLEQFRGDWELGKFSAAVEGALLKMAGKIKQPDRAQWPALVKQLGDSRYAHRESADAQLRAAGPLVLDYLQKLKSEELELEQVVRVRRIIDSIARPGEETPEQVAAGMVGDSAVWLALLRRPETATQRAAAKQLEALGVPLPAERPAPDNRSP
jgi:hypothetical protein